MIPEPAPEWPESLAEQGYADGWCAYVDGFDLETLGREGDGWVLHLGLDCGPFDHPWDAEDYHRGQRAGWEAARDARAAGELPDILPGAGDQAGTMTARGNTPRPRAVNGLR